MREGRARRYGDADARIGIRIAILQRHVIAERVAVAEIAYRRGIRQNAARAEVESVAGVSGCRAVAQGDAGAAAKAVAATSAASWADTTASAALFSALLFSAAL